MESPERLTLEESHKRFAVDFFNEIWPLLTKEGRTEEEDERMINAAHASLLHWQHVGKPINAQRGEWMVSHVYAVLGMAGPAAFHAGRCMRITEEQGLQDFDLAYAYEGLARAHAAAGDRAEAARFRGLAKGAGERVAEAEDRELSMGDLAAGPWYVAA